MYILGALEGVGALFFGFGTFVLGYGAATGREDATLATVIGIVAALALAFAVTSFVLGFLATKRSPAVMWTIVCFYSTLAVLSIVGFFGSAVSDGPRNNNLGIVATLVMSILVVSFTLTKDARMHYRSGKSSSGH
ncbi:hypothetical protein [Nocardiopsis rhodophaea]|uniref:hypothetical protein n=1 Tax=Nocardiopsis rhodophaea TaxID=280238 RepID=UPI0031D1930E